MPAMGGKPRGSSILQGPRTAALDAAAGRRFSSPGRRPLVFLAVVVAVFQSIFSWAQPVMNGLQALVLWSGRWMQSVLPDTPWRSLLIDGIWSGVGSVVVFLPQILLLFLFIGILEDSGYLARAALIADRTMAKIGLQGKSFIPLLSAYACAVPAIMSTRVIENKRDRMATIMIAPLMTCSARLPVYTLDHPGVRAERTARQGCALAASCHHAGALRARIRGGRCHRAAAEINGSEKPAHVLHAGDAALSLAHLALAQPAAGGPRQGVPPSGRHRHPAGGRFALGSGPPAAA